MVLGELGALLTSETLPDALPVVVGADCMLKVLDCGGARVSGKISPLMLKPAPVTLPCAMVKLALPELVKVRFCTPLVPTSTLPKLTVAGVTESCGCTPVPLRAMEIGRASCRERGEISVVAVSLKKKANCTLKGLDCPGGRVSGSGRTMRVSDWSVDVCCSVVKLALPELVKVRFCTPLVPTSTLPKLTLGGVTES